MRKTILQSVLLLLTLGLLWGSGYTIAKYAMTHNVPPLAYSFWQSLGPAIILLIVTLLREKKIAIDSTHLRYYGTCGLLGIAIPNTNMYFTAPHLPAGLLAVIVNTVPIMTYPLALLFQQEKFQWRRFVGVILGSSGLFFILLPHSQLPDLIKLPWALMTLLSPLSFALCALYIAKNRPPQSTSVSLSAGMLVMSTAILLPWLILQGQFHPIWQLDTGSQAIILEIILSSLGYIIFFQLIKIAGPVYYSLVGGVVALTGLLWGYLIFGEQIDLLHALATAMILSGIAVLSWA